MILFLEQYFMLFVVYNFMGWLFEEIICSIGYRQIVNQGFLIGPYLPVYGCGAMLNLIVLGGVQNTVSIFVLSIILTSCLEYFTSYLLEKIFHARWWDYSKYHYQLHGRVCLLGALTFGALSVVELKIVQPILEQYADTFSTEAVQYSAVIVFFLFLADVLISAFRQYGRGGYRRFPTEVR